MDRATMIAAILQAIQDDTTAIKVLRILITNNINNCSDAQLDALRQALGL